MQTPILRRLAGGTLALSLALLAACADDAAIPTATPPGASDQELIARLVALGYPADRIAREGDRFVVDGDMVFLRSDLEGPALARLRAPGAPSLQWASFTIAQAEMAAGPGIDLGPIAFNTGWTTASRDAMRHWSQTGSTKIRFYEGPPASYSVRFNAAMPANRVAQALVGQGVIEINPAYNGLSSGQKVWTMVHEIAHLIGYRHSNWQALGEPGEGVFIIPGTPQTDGASVFRGSPSSVPSWGGFSHYDGVANRAMYPGPAPTLTAQGFDAAGHPRLQWSAVSHASGYDVEYIYGYDEYDLYDGWVRRSATVRLATNVSATSFTDLARTRSGYTDCEAQYRVSTVYPSLKRPASVYTSAVFDVC